MLHHATNRWVPLAEIGRYDAPASTDGIDFVRQPEDELAKYRESIRRHVTALNRRDTAQAVADELVRLESAA